MRSIRAFLQDLWLYFKAGHSTYLAFVLSIINFIVLQYRLFIEYIPEAKGFISSLSSFAIIFVVTYIPLAMILGAFEYRRGEMTRIPKLNPYNQDYLSSEILIREALAAHIKGEDDRATKLIDESNKLLEKWKREK
jgi:hypothetical protein